MVECRTDSHSNYANLTTMGLLGILFWNGGGCMSSRLRVNPELKKLFSGHPDIFVYAESMIYGDIKRKLSGYHAFHHPALKKSCRRGIAVFFKDKFQFCLSKDKASKKFDLVWIKFRNNDDLLIFCFFYAPGDHKPIEERTAFYDEMRAGYKSYPPGTQFFS